MSHVETKAVAENAVEYEAPCVESVILPEDIEREVAYAGIMAQSGSGVAA